MMSTFSRAHSPSVCVTQVVDGVGEQPCAFCHPRHQVRNFSLETGPHVRSGPHLPFQSEARARQSGGGLVWKSSDSVVRTVAGWALGSELTDTSCKQSGSEESGPWDRAIETVGGGTPPGPAFGDDRESKGGPERQARLSGEMWAQSAAHQMDLRKTSGPHKDAPPAQPSCEAGALGDSPHVRPDLTSREKTPSEERWDPPDGSGTEPPGTCSGRKPPMCRESGKTLRSPSTAHQKTRARKTPYTCSECGKAFCRSAHLAQHRVVHTSAARPSAGSPT